MTRLGAFATGALTFTALAVIQALLFAATVAPVLTQPAWSLLAGGAVIASGLFGGALGLCVSAYGDLRRTVDLECRPVRERSTR
jgi:hypothetical protein